jgi:hypothetical protein
MNSTETPAKSELIKPESIRLMELWVQKTAAFLATNDDLEKTERIIKDNILSIRRTIVQGSHQVLFDPAVGSDVIRQLLAYDPQKLVAVDLSLKAIKNNQEQITKLLSSVGISCQVDELPGSVTKLSFVMDGTPREILLINQDARDVDLTAFGISQVDVMHIFLPTGVEEETEKQQQTRRAGEEPDFMAQDSSPVAHEGYSGGLKWQAYEQVRVGGFLCLAESHLIENLSLPPAVAELLGFTEFKISGRHPYTVSTSLFPDIINDQYPGAILRKDKEFSQEQFNLAKSVVESIETALFYIHALESMQLSYFTEGDGVAHPVDAIKKIRANLPADISQSVEILETDPDKREKIIKQTLAIIDAEIVAYQHKLINFFSQVSELQTMSDSIDSSLLQEKLGISRDQYGRLQSKKYPFALALLKADRQFQDAFKELAAFNFVENE